MKELLLSTLRSYTRYSASNPKWGVFVDGKLAILSSVRIYKTEGIAKKKAVEAILGRHCKLAERENGKIALEELISEGIVVIRQVV